MLRNVFLKSLRDQRRALLGWSLGIVSLVAMMAAIWPSFRDMPDLETFLANYPEEIAELVDIQAMTTGMGYLNAELFSLLLPILFIVFAIGRGARGVAGEEETGTLEVLLATRMSPVRLVMQQALALATSVALLGGALFAVTVTASALIDLGIGVGDAATGTLSMVLLGIEFGWLALAVGAAFGRRSWAVAAPTVAAVAGYVLYVVGQLVDAIKPWQPLSPFHQALEGGPLGAGLPLAFVWLVLPALMLVAAAAWLFDRRDIAAH